MIFFCFLLFFIPCFSEEICLKNIQQLTFSEMGFEKAGEAYFSPDDQTIIFQAVPKGKEHYQIYQMHLSDRTPKLVSTGFGACTCAFFHPTEDKIIFASSHEDPQERKKTKSDKYEWELTPYMNIYEANLDGSELKPLTFGEAYHAECAYSPDGSEIIYASNEDASMNLYVMNKDGSNVRQITHTKGCYNGGPFFSPNGEWIIFRSDREIKDYLQLYRIRPDGTEETQLTFNNAVNWAPYWHPNGEVVAFTTSLYGHHAYAIELLNVNTLKSFRVTYGTSFDGLPVFSHDGKKLLWTSKRSDDQSCQIFIADFLLPDIVSE